MFVPGRNMVESVLLMQEILYSMEASCSASRSMMVKLDTSKAYDMLNWDFLEGVLLRFGFPHKCSSSGSWVVFGDQSLVFLLMDPH